MQENIHPSVFKVTCETRSQALGQTPCLIWFTGLSGSGKSTLANGLESLLHRRGFHTYLLDGDNIRSGLSSDLSFSSGDRKENIRRIGEVAKLMIDAGLIVVSAFISPFIADRNLIKKMVNPERFFEIYVDCPLEVCEKRDVKGLYRKARAGLINEFTGISSPYEPPNEPFMTVKSNEEPLNLSIERIITKLQGKIKL